MNNTKRNTTTASKRLNPCPNAGSIIINEATVEGIDKMCNNVSETIFLRLKKLFTAAVFASQVVENESELAGVRYMLEYQLSDMFESIKRDCNQQLEFHVSGVHPFADVQPTILI